MARKKLNKSHRQRKRQEKLQRLISVCTEDIEVKLNTSGLPRTPTINQEPFTYPQTEIQSSQTATKSNPELQLTNRKYTPKENEEFLSRLDKKFIELFGSE